MLLRQTPIQIFFLYRYFSAGSTIILFIFKCVSIYSTLPVVPLYCQCEYVYITAVSVKAKMCH